MSYISKVFAKESREVRILDCLCRDGENLSEFRRLEFENVTGFDFDKDCLDKCSDSGYEWVRGDVHFLNFGAKVFDVVYSGFTLEISIDPSRVLNGYMKVLKDDGRLFVVSTYPDMERSLRYDHIGRGIMKSNEDDGGKMMRKFFISHGFKITKKREDGKGVLLAMIKA